MLIVYILLFIFALSGCKFAGKGFKAEESLSRNVTDSIKGIFIWLVFLSHFASYVTYTSGIDIWGKWISAQLGQLIVVAFLFYSGYGVCEAIKKRGSEYVKPFPKKRILKTLLHFDMAVLMFLIIQLCSGKTYTVSNIILSFIGWESFGNSNWYIFDVLVLYAITWISFMLIRKNNKIALLLATILSVIFIYFLMRTRWSWWYDTVLCYVAGMWFSIYKDQFLKIVTRNNFIWLVAAVFSLGSFYILHEGSFGLKGLILMPLSFCLAMVLILIKFPISNRLLALSGQYTFELYILQRIPMIILENLGLADFNHYVYFIACFGITIGLAFVFRLLTNKVDELIFKK